MSQCIPPYDYYMLIKKEKEKKWSLKEGSALSRGEGLFGDCENDCFVEKMEHCLKRTCGKGNSKEWIWIW
jgi:hypothetical protein